jgi:GT2 family glycosyltransferase/glycosyltransferase involved in cell wall biosynthesis/SAM-dependent methyltransferase
MRFSGERYMPTIEGETRYEHIHRYAWCLPLVVDKAVLDIACGEGYGSAMLARAARSVVGVDVSVEAVEHASATYGNGEALRFLQGDASRIPLDDSSVDVIVSFETIEHLLPQADMIAELRRVLKPDGYLIISSPNREIYSVKLGQNNPFHLKELNFNEFDELLKEQFPAVHYFGQRLARASFVYPASRDEGLDPPAPYIQSLIEGPQGVERRPPALVDPIYFVAIASRDESLIPSAPASMLLADDDPVSREMLTMSDAIVERDQRLAALYAETEAATIRYAELSQRASALSDDVVERDSRLFQLYHAVEQYELVVLRQGDGEHRARTAELEERARRADLEVLRAREAATLAAAEAERARATSLDLALQAGAARNETFERDLELVTLRESFEHVRNRAADLSVTVAQQTRTIDSQSETIAGLSTQLAVLNETLGVRDAELANLEKQNGQFTERAEALTLKIEDLSARSSDAESRNADLSVALEDAIAQRQMLENAINDLAAERAADLDVIEGLRLDLAHNAADAQARHGDLSMALEDALSQRQMLERTVEDLVAQRAADFDVIQELRLDLARGAADAEAPSGELRAALDEALSQRQTLERAVTDLVAKRAADSDVIETLTKAAELAQQRELALTGDIERLRSDLARHAADAEARHGELLAALEEARSRRQALEHTVNDLAAQHASDLELIDALTEAAEQARQQALASADDIALLRSDLARTNAQLEANARESSAHQVHLEKQALLVARTEAALREADDALNAALGGKFWTFQRPLRAATRLMRLARDHLELLGDAKSVPHAAAEPIKPVATDTSSVGHTSASEAKLLEESGLFDADWYLAHNADVAVAGEIPVEHYLRCGAEEGRRPSAHFDSAWYLTQYPDVAESGLNPLIHFLLYGEREGRSPSAAFDTAWYHRQYPDVRSAGLNSLLHYIHYGAAEGRHPHARAAASLAELRSLLPEAMEPFFEQHEPYDAWMSVNTFTSAQEADLRAGLAARDGRTPRISLITPVYNTPESLLRELVQSVRAQVYGDWELCLADDCSPSAHIKPLLAELAALDSRIKVTNLNENGGISVATNAAVEIATGSIIAFLDHDDLITPDCLGEIAIYYADHPDADVVYSDDDKIDLEGRRFAPQFKPDWSPALLLSYMYMGHVFTVRRSLFQHLGGFRRAFDGSQDYDFALRATEQARHVGHVPRILYHWRVVPGSTAASGDAKPESYERGRRAVEEALQRRAVVGVVSHPDWARQAKVGMFAIEFPDEGPQVTIIIPTYNQVGYLSACVESLARTTYRDFDVLVIDNDSDDPATLEYLADVGLRPRHRVVRIPKTGKKFSFAGLMNQAVSHASAEYVLLLNNDTEVVNPRWLSQMVGYGRMEGVGAVGARLYFEDRTIQHAGIVHGYHEGLVGHAFRNAPPHDWGYMGFIRTAREYSAVTAACLLTPRALFNSLNGFDEKNFAVAYNDVDYGYRVVQAGLRCVYCADAELFHYEGKSRPKKDDPREVAALRRIYGDWRDAWYNPNLSLENESFEPAMERQVGYGAGRPHVVFVSHNLNFEGAPNTLCDLAIGLIEAGHVTATVLSPGDGPLRAVYEAAGVPVRFFDPPATSSGAEAFLAGCAALGSIFLDLGADVVVANTLLMFFATTAARQVGLPTVWCQHESEPWRTYFDYVGADVRGYAYAAFAQTYRMTYVAEATRRSWRALETRGNFRVIRHGIPKERLAAERGRWTREEARAAIGAAPEDIVISLVGTVCARKGQADLVEAFERLPKDAQARAKLYIAGAHVEKPYAEALEASVASLGPDLADRVVVTGSVPDSIVYFAAADIYVCTSRIESAPRVIVEAMAFGLPILTTPVFGIPELVDENVNAFFYEPGDTERLADLIDQLIKDEALRLRLASHSVDSLESRPGFAEMVASYAKVIRQATLLRETPRSPEAGASAHPAVAAAENASLISRREMAYP